MRQQTDLALLINESHNGEICILGRFNAANAF